MCVVFGILKAHAKTWIYNGDDMSRVYKSKTRNISYKKNKKHDE